MNNILEPIRGGDEKPEEVTPLENASSLVLPEDENRPVEMAPTSSEGILDSSVEKIQLPAPLPEAIPAVGNLPGVTASSPNLLLSNLDEPKVENKRLVAMFVKEDDLRELWDRASRVRSAVITTVNDVPTAVELLNLIEIARNEMLAGREYFEQAERHVNEAEYRIALNQRVIKAANSTGVALFIYETVWAAVLLAFLFLVLGPAAFSSAAIPSSGWASPDVVFLLGSMTWGALGGVIGAWLSLVRHISKEHDFDRQHLLWYINSPVMGIGVGAVIFLILRAGLLSITGPTDSISSPLVIYLLAWLSGFQQNVFTDLIRRLLQVFKIDADEEDVVEPTSAVRLIETPHANVSPNGKA